MPPPIEMVTLLGPRDELLRTMERQFPLVDTHVRGNEMTFHGPAGELEIIDRLLDEPPRDRRGGQPLNRDAVERSISMLRDQTAERPADVLTMNIVSHRGPHRPAEDAEPEALRRRHRRAHHRLRHRPGRHRQDLPRDGQGGRRRCRPSRSTASSSPARRSRPASGSASSPARSTRRSTRTCGRSTTRSTT